MLQHRVGAFLARLRAWDDRDPCSVLGGHRSDPACLGSLTSTNHAAVPPLPSLYRMVHDTGSGRLQEPEEGCETLLTP